jgi:uncharacterized membrane protein
MRRAFVIALDTLHTLGLVVWLGGLIMIGAVVAPAAFHIAGFTRPQSASVVGESLRLFGRYAELSGAFMVGIQFLLRRRYQYDKTLYLGDALRQFITLGALMAAEYCRSILFPALDASQAAHRTAQFDHLHHAYTSISMVQVGLLVAVAGLTSWLQMPRTARATAAPAAAQSPAASNARASAPARKQPPRTRRARR